MSHCGSTNIRVLGALAFGLLVAIGAIILLRPRPDRPAEEPRPRTPNFSSSSHVDGAAVPEKEIETKIPVEKERRPESIPTPQAFVFGRKDTTSRDFSGRVLDMEGYPLTGASVDLTYEDSGTGVSTDFRGEFRMKEVAEGPFKLKVSKSGYAPILETSFEIPPDGATVDFRLSPGQRVRVRVVDTKGSPVKDSQVWIWEEDLRFQPCTRIASGEFEFSDLPAMPLTFVASVAGIEYEQRHNSLAPESRIVVPIHGSIDVRTLEPLSTYPDDFIRLVLAGPAGPDPRSHLELPPTEREDRTVRFGAVLPGEYEASLKIWVGRDRGGWDRWEQFGRSFSIVVRPREMTLLDLEP